jgi:predicted GNAT superfamily acetyltransferase
MTASPCGDWRKRALRQMSALPDAEHITLRAWNIQEVELYLKDIFQTHAKSVSIAIVDLAYRETKGTCD